MDSDPVTDSDPATDNEETGDSDDDEVFDTLEDGAFLWYEANRVQAHSSRHVHHPYLPGAGAAAARLPGRAGIPGPLQDERRHLLAQAWTPVHCVASWLRLGQFFTGSTGLDKAGETHDFPATQQDQSTEAAIAAYWEAKGGLPHPGDSDAGVVQASDVPQDVQDAIAAYAEQHGYGDAAETSGQPASIHPFYYNHVVPKMSQVRAVGGARTTSGEAVLVNNGQAPVRW